MRRLIPKTFMQKLSEVFAAGAFGALANSLALWALGAVGVTVMLGARLTPALTPGWLYPRLVWGGIWGVLFLLPFAKGRPWLRGLVFSLGPTIVQWCVVFPYKANKGFFGLDLGPGVPFFVILFNAIWGLAAAWWLIRTGSE